VNDLTATESNQWDTEPTDVVIDPSQIKMLRIGLVIVLIFSFVMVATFATLTAWSIREYKQTQYIEKHGIRTVATIIGYKTHCGRSSCNYTLDVIYNTVPSPVLIGNAKLLSSEHEGHLTTDYRSVASQRNVVILYDPKHVSHVIFANARDRSDWVVYFFPAITALMIIGAFFVTRRQMRLVHQSRRIVDYPGAQATAVIDGAFLVDSGRMALIVHALKNPYDRLSISVSNKTVKKIGSLANNQLTLIGDIRPSGVVFIQLADSTIIAPIGFAKRVPKRLDKKLQELHEMDN
jgi:hypothetical protein